MGGRPEALEARTLLSTADPLDTTRWTPLGPAPLLAGQTAGNQPVSGRVSGIAADPADPGTLYVAAAGGGVWKTTDAGASWAPLTDSQPTLFMGAIAVAPGDGRVIYAGTGEADNSYDSYYGRGILVSTDAGATWTLTGGDVFDRRAISQIAVDPNDPRTAYAAVSDYGTNVLVGNVGIWKTTDGGATWANVTQSGLPGYNPNTPYTDVAIDPSHPRTIYAAIGGYNGRSANGVIKSTDGGATWGYVGATLPGGVGDGEIRIAVSRSNPQVLYASIATPFNAATFNNGTSGTLLGLYKSADGGNTWSALTNTPNFLGRQGWYDNIIAVDPSNPGILYAGGQVNGASDSIIESRDGGATWTGLDAGADGRGPHSDHHAMAFDAAGHLLDGNDGGLWRLDSADPNAPGGVRWADLNTNLQTIQFTGIATDPSNPDVAFGGSQDNGTEKFQNSRSWSPIASGDGGFTRVDPARPATVYQEATGISLARSDDGGQSFLPATGGIDTSERSGVFVPYVLDPANSSRILLGATHVWESTDRGGNYLPIGGPGAVGWDSSSTISAIATIGRSIFVATDDNRILVTGNDGANWSDVTPNNPGAHYKGLAIDPTSPGTIAYAVADRFGVAHVLRTTDGGASWSDISGNLPDLPTNAIQVSVSGAARTFYVGTDDGVYSSVDGGATWTRLGVGFPHAQVVDLDVDPTAGLLAAGTHGRGLWELSLRGVPQTGPGASVDNTNSGYRAVGAGWALITGAGVGGSYRAHAAGSGAESSTWNLSRPAGSSYELFATWVARPTNATNAAYKIYDGATLVGTTAPVNQQAPPATLSVDGIRYLSLGTFATKSGVLRVVLTDAANGDVVADQVYAATPAPPFTGTPSGPSGMASPPPASGLTDRGTVESSPVTPVPVDPIPVSSPARRRPPAPRFCWSHRRRPA